MANKPRIEKVATSSTAIEIFVDDFGFDLFFNMGEDISEATGEALNYEKPDGSTALLTGTLSIYQNNNLKYVVKTGDLSLAGVYRFQPTFTLGDFTGTYPIFELNVSPKIVVTP